MYERLTDKARRAMHSAHEKAAGQDRKAMHSGDLLISLLQDESSNAAIILKTLQIRLHDLAEQLGRLTGSTSDVVDLEPAPAGHLLFRRWRKRKMRSVVNRVIENAMYETRTYHSSQVASQYLLLGLLRTEECVAAQALARCGVNYATVAEFANRLPEVDQAEE